MVMWVTHRENDGRTSSRRSGAEDLPRSNSLPDRVANLFYTHGVFCSAHPITVIAFTVTLVLLSCIPLYSLQVPSNVPHIFKEGDNNITGETPRWMSLPPIYIQQVIVKSAVSPWDPSLTVSDSVRGPVAQAFSIYDTIQNYQYRCDDCPSSFGDASRHDTGDGLRISLEDICVHVESPNNYLGSLPQFSCLAVSPASLWRRDLQALYSDPSVVSTIYKYHDALLGKVSLAEILFGVPLRLSGVRRYSLKPRQRVVQYSITLFLSSIHPGYMDGLKSHLLKMYPRLDTVAATSPPALSPLLHVHYAGDFDYHDFIPLLLTYVGLFFYMYFSVRKIELVTSKVGMALSAVLTVVASLLMSVGLCLMFGLDPAASTRGREVFPYLVIVVGLENILVLTKSVVSTQSHLDSKIRLAQGLSKEGWSITKNLLTEVTILTCGLLTLVPAIQEFCMFAMVGLLCDFFLQTCFFATVLSLDIRNQSSISSGTSRSNRAQAHITATSHHHYSQNQYASTGGNVTGGSAVARHRAGRPSAQSQGSEGPVAGRPNSRSYNIPKRLRLVYFWARTRIVQRMFMVCMVIWIGGFLYSADLIQTFISLHQRGRVDPVSSHLRGPYSSSYLASHATRNGSIDKLKVDWGGWSSGLAPTKWCYLVSEYNSSGECRLAIAPPIRLTVVAPQPPSSSSAVGVDTGRWEEASIASGRRHPWATLADALDPSDDFISSDTFSDDGLGDGGIDCVGGWHEGCSSAPLLPSTPLELLLVTALVAISIIVVAYTALALYHCVCTRNYAQWRSGNKWWLSSDSADEDLLTQVPVECVPLTLEGHSQRVEWVVSDSGPILASSCLAGDINVWDSTTGQQLAHIDRKRYFMSVPKNTSSKLFRDQPLSDYESGSPPPAQDSFLHNRQHNTVGDGHSNSNRGLHVQSSSNTAGSSSDIWRRTSWEQRSFADLTSLIKTDFRANIRSDGSGFRQRHQAMKDHGFDFGPAIRMLYLQNEWMESDIPGGDQDEDLGSLDSVEGETSCPQVWCMDTRDNVIVVGTSSGVIELWQANNGQFKCLFDDACGVGVTCIKMAAGSSRIVVARLTGQLDVLALDWIWHQTNPSMRRIVPPPSDDTITNSMYSGDHYINQTVPEVTAPVSQAVNTPTVATHWRCQSAGRADDLLAKGVFDLRVLRVASVKAHHQPITAIAVDAGRILTASHDHTLKVISLVDQMPVFTLHGHCGPVTQVFIDRDNPLTAGSASNDGMLCVWDLLTGACVFSVDGHDGPITSLTYSPSYVLSLGADDRLRVWDRFQGHLLNTIPVSNAYCIQMVMLSHSLLVTSKQGSLIVWDVRCGEVVRTVKLGEFDDCEMVCNIVSIPGGVACDYGRQLRLVTFPLPYQHRLLEDKMD